MCALGTMSAAVASTEQGTNQHVGMQEVSVGHVCDCLRPNWLKFAEMWNRDVYIMHIC